MVARKDLKREVPRKIAIYGKAGIGKSITSSNLSAVLSHLGERVMQIGCDPKRDSVALLCHRIVPTILEKLTGGEEAGAESITQDMLSDVIFRGYNNIVCAESGGPRPGIGCAGRGVMVALQLLEQHKIFSRYEITFAVFDILGDVVCGGFSQPMRSGYAREIYIIVNGEPLSLFITNNILKAVKSLSSQGYDVGVAGLISNQRGVPYEKEIVDAFARKIGVPVVEHVPRSSKVQEAESRGKTVIEAFPDSEQANVYKRLAKKVLENPYIYIPEPVSGMDDVLDIVRVYIK
jgi:nitrogenase iron protein NifH